MGLITRKLNGLLLMVFAFHGVVFDEIRMNEGNSERYFDSFYIENNIFYGVSGKMVREMGSIECIGEDICVGGPYLNGSDLSEILNVTIVLNS